MVDAAGDERRGVHHDGESGSARAVGRASRTACHPRALRRLVSFDPNVYRFVGRLLKDRDVRFMVADGELAAGQDTYPRGTLVILKGSNKADLDIIARIGSDIGATVVPSSGWMGRDVRLREAPSRPKAEDRAGRRASANATSYGMLWHTLEVDTPIPYTSITADGVRNIDLSRYNVIVFPDGNYSEAKTVLEKLQAGFATAGRSSR